jgi:hypothetical protein
MKSAFCLYPRLLFAFLLLGGSSVQLYSQESASHTVLRNGDSVHKNNGKERDSGFEDIKGLYLQSLEQPKELINGKEYQSYYARSEYKPLLFPKQKRTASIITKSRQYNNITLDYDTYLDELIYTDTSRTVNFRFPQVALNKDNVDGFVMNFEEGKMTFRNFRMPESEGMGLAEGFYEVAYEGKCSMLIQHKSSIYQKDGIYNYNYSPRYLIRTGRKYENIRTEKDLLQVFGEKAKQVKTFIRTSKIKFRKADKNEIISILRFYDSV